VQDLRDLTNFSARFAGFNEFQKFSSTGKPVDQVHDAWIGLRGSGPLWTSGLARTGGCWDAVACSLE
jgi:hypothetical protein